jgi:nucleoside-diphosphate-sugar epimerase
VERLSKGEPVRIYRGMEGVRREWLYVEDAVAAYLLLADDVAERGNSDLEPLTRLGAVGFNVGPGSADVLTTRQVVTRILEFMDRDPDFVEIVGAGREPQIGDQYLDSDKFRQRFPQWQPRSFEEGLEETILWHKLQHLAETASEATRPPVPARARVLEAAV